MRARAQVVVLGALSPDVQNKLQAQVAASENVEEQARTDLLLLSEQGGHEADVQSFYDKLNALAATRTALVSEMATMSDGDAAAWSAKAQKLLDDLHAAADQLAAARGGAVHGTEFRGLYWGLGVSVVGVALFALVWRGAKKPRRRRVSYRRAAA